MLLFHPEFAARTCGDCMRFVYDDAGEVLRRPAKIGLPVLRPSTTPPPCFKCPKIPPWASERSQREAVELSEKNVRAFIHYRGCRATNSFPADSIVRRNAAIIREVWDDFENVPTMQLLALFGARRMS